MIKRIERLTGRRCRYSLSDWRLGDQPYYVSDTGLFQSLTGWKPTTSVEVGLARLCDWITTYHLTDVRLTDVVTSASIGISRWKSWKKYWKPGAFAGS